MLQRSCITLLGLGLSWFAASCAPNLEGADDRISHTLESHSQTVWISVNGGAETEWTLAPETNPDVFSTVCEADTLTKVLYRSDVDEVLFEVSGDDEIRFAIVQNDGSRAINALRCLPPRSAYSGSYSASRPSAERYPEDIDPVLQAYFSDQTPGALAGIWRNGEQVYLRAIGLLNLEESVRRSVEDPFEIASISKEFTAVSIMQLVERGEMSLDDKVSNFFPDLPYADRLSVRHLLAHTSGLENRTYTDKYTIRSSFDRAKALDQLADQELSFEPGASYLYSNAGMTLAALIAEKVSEQSRAAYVQERILKPAGMSETLFLSELNSAQQEEFIVGYEQSVGPPQKLPTRLHPTAPFGSGDLVSTVRDLRRWHQALKGGTLISRESFELMIEPVTLADGSTSQRGLAFMVGAVAGERLIYNSGDIYTHTRHAFLADSDLSIIVNTNLSPANDFDQAGRIRNQLIGKLKNTRYMDLYGTRIEVDSDY